MSSMKAVEEELTDLHLSLDCEPSRTSRSPDVTSHTCYLSRQHLKNIPEYTLQHTHLQNLYLEGNEMSSLPENMFSSLPHLVWLDVRNNQLTGLPVDIGQHRCLKTLLLEGNPITELPVELGHVTTLRALSLRNCPVSFPPQVVLQAGLTHILHFLLSFSSQTSRARQDVPAVERLALSEELQASQDVCEEDDEDDEGELRRFQELREKMIQMERADLGLNSPAMQTQNQLQPAGGDKPHNTHHLTTSRSQESMRGQFPDLHLSAERNKRRSEGRKRAAMKEWKEKQALLDQRRKDEELLLQWRNQARILQERKLLEQKEDKREEINIPYGTDLSSKEKNAAESKTDVLKTSQSSSTESRAARDRELEQRIRSHIQTLQERHRRDTHTEEIRTCDLHLQQVKQLQVELAERRREREMEYRLTAFTGESSPTPHHT